MKVSWQNVQGSLIDSVCRSGSHDAQEGTEELEGMLDELYQLDFEDIVGVLIPHCPFHVGVVMYVSAPLLPRKFFVFGMECFTMRFFRTRFLVGSISSLWNGSGLVNMYVRLWFACRRGFLCFAGFSGDCSVRACDAYVSTGCFLAFMLVQ